MIASSSAISRHAPLSSREATQRSCCATRVRSRNASRRASKPLRRAILLRVRALPRARVQQCQRKRARTPTLAKLGKKIESRSEGKGARRGSTRLQQRQRKRARAPTIAKLGGKPESRREGKDARRGSPRVEEAVASEAEEAGGCIGLGPSSLSRQEPKLRQSI